MTKTNRDKPELQPLAAIIGCRPKSKRMGNEHGGGVNYDNCATAVAQFLGPRWLRLKDAPVHYLAVRRNTIVSMWMWEKRNSLFHDCYRRTSWAACQRRKRSRRNWQGRNGGNERGGGPLQQENGRTLRGSGYDDRTTNPPISVPFYRGLPPFDCPSG